MKKRICVSPILFSIVLTVSLNAQPKAGDWKVPTRFGQFVSTVNSTGTQIVKLATTFSNYTFGGITQNGTVTSQPSPGWPISNSQFAITTSINPTGTIKLTLNGTFTQSGDQASGTWSMLVSGQTDSDVWSTDTLTSGATARWIQTNGPYAGQVYSFAVSSTNLFAGTDGGGVFLSTNNGTSWSSVNTGLTNTRVHALALSGTNVFAGASGGVFLSTNNGTSWTAVNTGLTNTNVWSIAVSPASGVTNLFAGTFGGGVFLSTNNGTGWTAVNTGLTNPYVPALAISPASGGSGANLFAATTTGGVFLSTNNGTGWTAVNTGLTNPYVPALAVSGTNLFAGTYDGVFLSTNNGTSWTQTSVTNTVVTSFALSGTNLFAGTTVGVFLSTNNGTSWTAVNTGLTDANVWSLAISGANLFAGTMSGGVWRRALVEMVTSVERFSTDLPTHFSLDQNYPNPFNPSSTISFSLPFKSNVSLRVFDALGRQVSVLVAEELPAGNYTRQWNAANVASGVYFYRLQAGEYIDTKKTILLK
ncbi:MAG: T9SS type A sorting domain-containing protein [Ignavibacteria bacterium]|nr:T9SS type A sorting domain-containing protein [Ignavibacteria bacterium]